MLVTLLSSTGGIKPIEQGFFREGGEGPVYGVGFFFWGGGMGVGGRR